MNLFIVLFINTALITLLLSADIFSWKPASRVSIYSSYRITTHSSSSNCLRTLGTDICSWFW